MNCITCGKELDAAYAARYGKCSCAACKSKAYRARVKLKVLEAYGSKCQCCAETNPIFLAVDHINGGGNLHRGTIRQGKDRRPYVLSPIHVYLDIIKEGFPKDKYRLLCHNCNFAYHLEGTCPHKSGKTVNDYLDDLKNKTKLQYAYAPANEKSFEDRFDGITIERLEQLIAKMKAAM